MTPLAGGRAAVLPSAVLTFAESGAKPPAASSLRLTSDCLLYTSIRRDQADAGARLGVAQGALVQADRLPRLQRHVAVESQQVAGVQRHVAEAASDDLVRADPAQAVVQRGRRRIGIGRQQACARRLRNDQFARADQRRRGAGGCLLYTSRCV